MNIETTNTGFTMFKLVEKKNRLAVHGIFDSLERAERHLAEVIPVYVQRGYFMDKTLTPSSFELVKAEPKAETR